VGDVIPFLQKFHSECGTDAVDREQRDCSDCANQFDNRGLRREALRFADSGGKEDGAAEGGQAFSARDRLNLTRG
jgi:hypothetical protein